MTGSLLLQQRLSARLTERRTQNLLRQRRSVESPQQPALAVDGSKLLSFCSNDYLGLANHPDVVAAFKRGLDEYGAGSGASHLVTGHTKAHAALEEELAAFTGRSRALLFGSGFMANVGVLTTLPDDNDHVFEDKLNHASLLDGGRFSGASFRRYPHLDMARLGASLQAAEGDGVSFVVSDGVFSMDGDLAPLGELLQTAERHNAVVMIDDAHGFGCLGATGGGIVELAQAQGVVVDEQRLPVLVGTLGKAFGVMGGYIAADQKIIDVIRSYAPGFIFTTSLSPVLVAGVLASVRHLKVSSEERTAQHANAAMLKTLFADAGLPVMVSNTHIVPLMVGDPVKAKKISDILLAEYGVYVQPINYPTVPRGTERLRFTPGPQHTEAMMRDLTSALIEIWGRVDIRAAQAA
jgi:5-aminolevulinate synthase